MKKEIKLSTGIDIKFDKNENIKSLNSKYKNTEPSKITIDEFKNKKERIKQNNNFLKEVFLNFGKAYES